MKLQVGTGQTLAAVQADRFGEAASVVLMLLHLPLVHSGELAIVVCALQLLLREGTGGNMLLIGSHIWRGGTIDIRAAQQHCLHQAPEVRVTLLRYPIEVGTLAMVGAATLYTFEASRTDQVLA